MFAIALSVYIILHTIIRIRGRYLISIMVNKKIVNDYYSNYIPVAGDIIVLENNKSYVVLHKLIRRRKFDERIVVDAYDVNQGIVPTDTDTKLGGTLTSDNIIKTKPDYKFTGPPTNPTGDPDAQ